MESIESAIVWIVVFTVMMFAVFIGIRTSQVTFAQIDNYEKNDSPSSPADITRIVEVIYETIDNI